MSPLQELIREVITQTPSEKVLMVSLRAVARKRHPTVDIDERDMLLLHALEELASCQVIRLPSSRAPGAWLAVDKLPRWVIRFEQQAGLGVNKKYFSTKEANGSCSERLILRDLRGRAPWEGKMLEIGPSLPLSEERLRQALIVNDYMRQRSSSPEWLPVNERSLQLFGYEKALKNAHKVGLFSGRITLDDLDCYHVPEPIQGVRWPQEAVKAPILIVENSTTFYSAWRANQYKSTYSAVVFGRGKMLKGTGLATDSLEELREESAERAGAERLPDLHYFGDIDPEGAEIPIMINQQRKAQGLPPLVPARALYQRLLDFPDQPPEHDWPKGLSRADISEWFGESLACIMLDAFDRRRRWAQEWITQSIFTDVFSSKR